MTIPELLAKIAKEDELPRFWRVQKQKEWKIDGLPLGDGIPAPETREETVLEYRSDDLPQPNPAGQRWEKLGTIETAENLPDWIDAIILERGVPSAVVFPFSRLAAKAGLGVELAKDPAAEIAF